MTVLTLSMTSRPTPPKPKEGDKKIIKGVEHIRVYCVVRDHTGAVVGYDCGKGRQRFRWIPLKDYDRYYSSNWGK